MKISYFITKCTPKGHLFVAGLQKNWSPLISDDVEEAALYADRKQAQSVADLINRNKYFDSGWFVMETEVNENKSEVDPRYIPNVTLQYDLNESEAGDIYHAVITPHAWLEVDLEEGTTYAIDVDPKRKSVKAYEVEIDHDGSIKKTTKAPVTINLPQYNLEFPNKGIPGFEEVFDNFVFPYAQMLMRNYNGQGGNKEELEELAEIYDVPETAITYIADERMYEVQNKGETIRLYQYKTGAWLICKTGYCVLEITIKEQDRNIARMEETYAKHLQMCANEIFKKRGDTVYGSESLEKAEAYFKQHEPKKWRIEKNNGVYTFNGGAVVTALGQYTLDGKLIAWQPILDKDKKIHLLQMSSL